jgi:hypothetical protein
MFQLASFQRLCAAFFDTQSDNDRAFLSAAADAGDLERRMALLEEGARQRACGVVAGLYPR